MSIHDIYLEWIILATEGIRRAEFPLLDRNELSLLREKESSWIEGSKIYAENGKTIIELI